MRRVRMWNRINETLDGHLSFSLVQQQLEWEDPNYSPGASKLFSRDDWTVDDSFGHMSAQQPGDVLPVFEKYHGALVSVATCMPGPSQ